MKYFLISCADNQSGVVMSSKETLEILAARETVKSLHSVIMYLFGDEDAR